jgi:hypothetical protein
MSKKKKATTGPKAKKKSTTKKKKQLDATQVREDLAGIVKSGAKGITEAVMDQAMHGELAPAKYLLEMAGVYPPVNDGEQATEEEDCLAKTLLDRLNISRKASHDTEEPEKNTESGGEVELKEHAEDECAHPEETSNHVE